MSGVGSMIWSMGEESHGSALVWIGPGQAGLMRRVLDGVGLEASDVGVASPSGVTEEVRDAFPDARLHTDWRHLLTSSKARIGIMGVSWALAPSPRGEQAVSLNDGEVHELNRQAGRRVFSLSPLPATLLDFESMAAGDQREPIALVPRLSASPAFADASELLGQLGAARSVSIAMRGASVMSPLGARLFDAMQTLQAWLGVPDAVDCSLITPSPSGALRLAQPDTLRMLRGDITASLRYASGLSAASVALSDRAGRWFSGATVVGDEGSIRVTETGIEQFDARGALVGGDVDAEGARSGADDPEDLLVDAIVRALRRHMDPHAARPAPTDTRMVLAMCEAALLSARTGQPESPEMVLRMARAGDFGLRSRVG